MVNETNQPVPEDRGDEPRCECGHDAKDHLSPAIDLGLPYNGDVCQWGECHCRDYRPVQGDEPVALDRLVFLRERQEHIERNEFHPQMWEWWHDYQREPHEWGPSSIEDFDEAVAWALARLGDSRT